MPAKVFTLLFIGSLFGHSFMALNFFFFFFFHFYFEFDDLKFPNSSIAT